MFRKSKFKLSSGSVLVFTLIIMFVMLVIGLGIMATTVTERKSSLSTEKTTASFQIADTGAEKILQIIKNSSGPISGMSSIKGCPGGSPYMNENIFSGSYTVTFLSQGSIPITSCTNDVSNITEIKSVGTYANTTRAVQVTAPCSSPYKADGDTVGLWHFEEPDGAPTLKDSSGKGNDGTPNGTTKVAGICNARSFGGGSDRISVPDSDDWTFGSGNFTIEFWVNFSDLENGGNQYNIISQYKDGGNMWFIDKAAASLPNRPNQLGIMWVSADGANYSYFQMLSPGWPASPGVWYHIAFVRSGATGYIYINGISQALKSSTIFYDWANIDAPLYIGKWGGGDGYSLKGSMDEVWISKTGKSASDINTDFVNGCKKFSPKPSACP
jgi:hypothetical protein